MIKGLYAAVTAMLAGVKKQELKAHNIANLNTPGFKQIFTTLEEFQRTNVVSSAQAMPEISPQFVGTLGLGVMTTEAKTKFGNGALKSTGQPFDFAIQGAGFFRVMTSGGERFTRDGRFIRDVNQNLVTVDGNQVLDSTGNSIRIPDGLLSVDGIGKMRMNDIEISQLGIAEFVQPEIQLQRDAGNLYKASDVSAYSISNSSVHQGYLEMSNVNVVEMVIGAKTYEAAQKLVQIQDELLGKSISTLGKIA
jgi:flagellar basal-body rod protein FlgF